MPSSDDLIGMDTASYENFKFIKLPVIVENKEKKQRDSWLTRKLFKY